MFSYYGSKSKVINLYPPPMFNEIIEPFAGSARYSLKYWENDILLVDKFNQIIDLWSFLKICNKIHVINLPIPEVGSQIDKTLSYEESLLIGYIITQAGVYAAKTASPFSKFTAKRQLKNIADNIYKVKHWNFKCCDYSEIKNRKVTWFVDPPYFKGGHKYKENNKNIDYTKLGKWCKNLEGQSIVCENTSAAWLNFLPMKKQRGIKSVTTEAIWSNMPTNYDWQQKTIFK